MNQTPSEIKLSGNELLFFPRQNDLSPFKRPVSSPGDLTRKRNYLLKIASQSNEERREFRAKRDARYLHKNANNANETSNTTLRQDGKHFFCLDHLIGRCNNQCDKWHQMRHQRLFGVCKFYINDRCANGDSCVFMHEEFPCRFYYLDLKHPQSMDADTCRFKHGGPLSERLRLYFKRQIEIWVKKITQNTPQQFDIMLKDFLHKFDAKQMKLEQELTNSSTSSDLNAVSSSGVLSTFSDKFPIESILSTREINKLKAMSITTVAHINQTPVDELIECGLTLDQIYQITTNTCHDRNDSSTNSQNDGLSIDSSVLHELDFEMKENSLRGFTDAEVEIALEMCEMKRPILQIQNSKDQVNVENEINKPARMTKEPTHNKTSNFESQQIEMEVSQNETDDSDHEFDLVINEDTEDDS